MSRRQAREIALQALYQLDLRPPSEGGQAEKDETLALDAALMECQAGIPEPDREFARSLVRGTRENLPQIDQLLGKFSHAWRLGRMAVVDRNIARLAAYEMRFAEPKLTPNIAINEAVELAKTFGAADSSKFVNGLLGALAKHK